MSKLQEPFRYDYVGSFLRTEELKKATTQGAEYEPLSVDVNLSNT